MRAKGYQAMSQRIWNVAYVDDCNLFSGSLKDIEETANVMYKVLKFLGLSMHPDKLEFFARKAGDGLPVIRVYDKLVRAKNKDSVFRALGLFTNLNGDTEAQKKQAKLKVLKILNRAKLLRLSSAQVARIINTCVHPVFLYASEFTHWPKKWLNEIEGIGRKAVKHGSVALRRFPSDVE